MVSRFSNLLFPHTHTHTTENGIIYILSIQYHFYIAFFYISLLEKYMKLMELLGSSTSNMTLWFHSFLVSSMSFGWMVEICGQADVRGDGDTPCLLAPPHLTKCTCVSFLLHLPCHLHPWVIHIFRHTCTHIGDIAHPLACHHLIYAIHMIMCIWHIAHKEVNPQYLASLLSMFFRPHPTYTRFHVTIHSFALIQ